MPLSKGVAVVTGAAQGIGQGIALRLAEDGFDLVINDVPSNKENLDSTAELITSKGRRVLRVFGDVSREEDVEDIVDKAVAKLGSLDVVSQYTHILCSSYDELRSADRRYFHQTDGGERWDCASLSNYGE